jgi:hypothetical protein
MSGAATATAEKVRKFVYPEEIGSLFFMLFHFGGAKIRQKYEIRMKRERKDNKNED